MRGVGPRARWLRPAQSPRPAPTLLVRGRGHDAASRHPHAHAFPALGSPGLRRAVPCGRVPTPAPVPGLRLLRNSGTHLPFVSLTYRPPPAPEPCSELGAAGLSPPRGGQRGGHGLWLSRAAPHRAEGLSCLRVPWPGRAGAGAGIGSPAWGGVKVFWFLFGMRRISGGQVAAEVGRQVTWLELPAFLSPAGAPLQFPHCATASLAQDPWPPDTAVQPDAPSPSNQPEALLRPPYAFAMEAGPQESP